MTSIGEREEDAPAERTRGQAEFLEWAAGQPVAFGLVDGRPARLADEHQGGSRLTLARDVVIRALSSAEAADAWLATPTRELGGLSPGDLITESDEGSRLALLALVRQHRQMLDAVDD